MPRWTTFRINSLIAKILLSQKIKFEDFFNLNHNEWKNIFDLNDKEILDLENGKKELVNYSFLVEDMINQGYELIPLNSADYPRKLKDNLKLKFAPPLLYIKGNKNLLHDETIAIVGSRKADDISLQFTKNISTKATKEYKSIVSGGAKGIDQTALEETLKIDGHTILVLPQGILTYSSGMKKYYKDIINGNLLILSTFFPKAPWSVGLAMARNKYIYGLAKEIYVAQSDSKGGTWSGAIEGLKLGQTIYVREPKKNEKNANDLLILKGAKAVDINGNVIKKKYNKILIEEKIKNLINGVALTAKEIKEKINYDIDNRKFSIYLSELPFVKKEKKANSNLFIYKNKIIQPDLFNKIME